MSNILATIEKILSVEPIPGADKIDKVTVLGWDCVVRKGQFVAGELCIYIQLDTLIPKCLFTGNSDDQKEMIRLKTAKFKGQLSQGLVLKLGDGNTPELNAIFYSPVGTGINAAGKFLSDWVTSLKEGTDVSEDLGIKKYEKQIPAQLQGLVLGNFPSIFPKTDEVRIQNAPSAIQELLYKPYYITTKLDGTSSTFYKLDDHFGVCSRNMELKEGDNIYWKMAKKYNLDSILEEGFMIQGEIVGPSIQKNPLGLLEPDLFIFNVFLIKQHRYCNLREVVDFCKEHQLKMVPVVEETDSFSYTIDDLLKKATGVYPGTKNRIEGIVVRSVTDFYSPSLEGRMSFKVLNNEYLLKDEE